jgi:hypothetical protein
MSSLAEYYFRTWANTIFHLQKAAADIGLSSLRRMSERPAEPAAQEAPADAGEQRRSPKPHQEPIEEQIRRRAYAIWLEEGRPQGRDKENWERAKADIESQRASRGPPPVPGPYENLR